MLRYKILIEKVRDAQGWVIVARECSTKGFRAGEMPILEQGMELQPLRESLKKHRPLYRKERRHG